MSNKFLVSVGISKTMSFFITICILEYYDAVCGQIVRYLIIVDIKFFCDNFCRQKLGKYWMQAIQLIADIQATFLWSWSSIICYHTCTLFCHYIQRPCFWPVFTQNISLRYKSLRHMRYCSSRNSLCWPNFSPYLIRKFHKDSISNRPYAVSKKLNAN